MFLVSFDYKCNYYLLYIVLLLMGMYSHRLYISYTTFYCVGQLMAMNVPFVGFQPIKVTFLDHATIIRDLFRHLSTWRHLVFSV